MEVDTDDDVVESSNLNEARSKGPPPDVTYTNHSKRYHQSTNHNSKSNINYSLISNKNSSENQPLLSGAELSDHDQMEGGSDFIHLSCNHFENDPEFSEKVKQVEFAIDHDILPQRIYEGSSGSYFAKNSEYVCAFFDKFCPILFIYALILLIENSSCIQAEG